MSSKHPLQKLLEENEYEVYSYSGRGMYGKRCLGVYSQSPGLGKIMFSIIKGVSNLSEKEVDDIAKAVVEYQTDSIGKEMVIYFPSVSFDETDDFSDDGDEFKNDEWIENRGK